MKEEILTIEQLEKLPADDLVDYVNDVSTGNYGIGIPGLRDLVHALKKHLTETNDKAELLESNLAIAQEGLDFVLEELEQAIEQGYEPITSSKQMLRLIKDSND